METDGQQEVNQDVNTVRQNRNNVSYQNKTLTKDREEQGHWCVSQKKNVRFCEQSLYLTHSNSYKNESHVIDSWEIVALKLLCSGQFSWGSWLKELSPSDRRLFDCHWSSSWPLAPLRSLSCRSVKSPLIPAWEKTHPHSHLSFPPAEKHLQNPRQIIILTTGMWNYIVAGIVLSHYVLYAVKH